LPLEAPTEKRVDWKVAKRCLAALQREAPYLLNQAVVIGGIACWFYRHQLSRARDPDFGVPDLTPAEEQLWLSKDIDFTNFFGADARELLKDHVLPDTQGRPRLVLAGVPIGFAQVGLTFDPETAWAESWIATFTADGLPVECRILHPISLYREKLALSQRRELPADGLHCSLMAEFLRYETAQQAEALSAAATLVGKAAPLQFLLAMRDRARETCYDQRVRVRLQRINSESSALAPSERKLVEDLCIMPSAGG
jgi:hypothetical protein